MTALQFKLRGRALALRVVLGVGLACTATGLALAGPVLDRIRASGKLVIAHNGDEMPFSYIGADKKPLGYTLDLCLSVVEAVRRQLGMKSLTPEFLLVDGKTRFTAIAEGKAELHCSETTNTAERRQRFAFAIPHYIAGTRLLVRADSPITDLSGFAFKRLVVTAGTTTVKIVRERNTANLLNIEVVEVPSHERGIEMVERGEAEGFAMDDVVLYGLAAQRPNPLAFKVVGKFMTIEPLAIMLPLGEPELKNIVDNELRRLIANRDAYAIYDKWFVKAIPPANKSLNLPMNYLLREYWKYPTDFVP